MSNDYYGGPPPQNPGNYAGQQHPPQGYPAPPHQAGSPYPPSDPAANPHGGVQQPYGYGVDPSMQQQQGAYGHPTPSAAGSPYQQYPPQGPGYPPQQQQGGYYQHQQPLGGDPYAQQQHGASSGYYGDASRDQQNPGNYASGQQPYGGEHHGQPTGPGAHDGQVGPDGERGLMSTVAGGTAGAFIGKKLGIGKLGGAAAVRFEPFCDCYNWEC
jgi:hypothetical protein